MACLACFGKPAGASRYEDEQQVDQAAVTRRSPIANSATPEQHRLRSLSRKSWGQPEGAWGACTPRGGLELDAAAAAGNGSGATCSTPVSPAGCSTPSKAAPVGSNEVRLDDADGPLDTPRGAVEPCSRPNTVTRHHREERKSKTRDSKQERVEEHEEPGPGGLMRRVRRIMTTAIHSEDSFESSTTTTTSSPTAGAAQGAPAAGSTPRRARVPATPRAGAGPTPFTPSSQWRQEQPGGGDDTARQPRSAAWDQARKRSQSEPGNLRDSLDTAHESPSGRFMEEPAPEHECRPGTALSTAWRQSAPGGPAADGPEGAAAGPSFAFGHFGGFERSCSPVHGVVRRSQHRVERTDKVERTTKNDLLGPGGITNEVHHEHSVQTRNRREQQSREEVRPAPEAGGGGSSHAQRSSKRVFYATEEVHTTVVVRSSSSNPAGAAASNKSSDAAGRWPADMSAGGRPIMSDEPSAWDAMECDEYAGAVPSLPGTPTGHGDGTWCNPMHMAAGMAGGRPGPLTSMPGTPRTPAMRTPPSRMSRMSTFDRPHVSDPGCMGMGTPPGTPPRTARVNDPEASDAAAAGAMRHAVAATTTKSTFLGVDGTTVHCGDSASTRLSTPLGALDVIDSTSRTLRCAPRTGDGYSQQASSREAGGPGLAPDAQSYHHRPAAATEPGMWRELLRNNSGNLRAYNRCGSNMRVSDSGGLPDCAVLDPLRWQQQSPTASPPRMRTFTADGYAAPASPLPHHMAGNGRAYRRSSPGNEDSSWAPARSQVSNPSLQRCSSNNHSGNRALDHVMANLQSDNVRPASLEAVVDRLLALPFGHRHGPSHRSGGRSIPRSPAMHSAAGYY